MSLIIEHVVKWEVRQATADGSAFWKANETVFIEAHRDRAVDFALALAPRENVVNITIEKRISREGKS